MEVVFFQYESKEEFIKNVTYQTVQMRHMSEVSSSNHFMIPKSSNVNILVFKMIIRVKEISNVVEKDATLWLTLYLKIGQM